MNSASTNLLFSSLPDKQAFLELISSSGMADTGQRSAGIVIVDIKGLGNINLKYGSAFGDRLLEKAALYLINSKPPGSRLYRGSGDEFIILDEQSETEILQQFGSKITTDTLELVPEISEKPVLFKLRAAAAFAKNPGESLENVYLRAWQAFSKSKKLKVALVGSEEVLPDTDFFPMKSKIIRRVADLEMLNRAFRESMISKGSIIFVEGHAGIGKTKLINQFLSDLRDTYNPLVLIGIAQHVRIPAPYHLIRKALSRYHHQNTDKFYEILNRLSGSDIRELYQLMPDLDAERLTAMDFSSPGQHYDYALFDSLVRFLSLISETGPLLVWFDDFHDADAGSWNFLRYLSNSISTRSLMVVVTSREIDFENPRHPQSLRDLFFELRTMPSIRFHRMQPFTLEETAAFCQEFKFFRRLPPKGVEFIYQISKGNPLYIVELAKYLVATPRLIRKIEKGQTQEGFEIPSTIQDIVLGELNSLSREELEFTRFLSVFGNELNPGLVGIISGRNDAHVKSLLDELRFKNVITEASHPGAMQFSHPMIRSVVYNAMSMKKRRGYHMQVAEALETRRDHSADINQLADHYYLAAEWEKSYKYAHACGLQAKQVYDYETAFLYFSRAREIAKIQRQDANFAEMVQKEGEILQFLGRNDEAYKRLAKSAKLMESRGNLYGTAYNLLLMAQILGNKADYDNALQTLAKAKKQISDNVALFGMILGEECWIYRVLGDYAKSIEAGTAALTILQKSAPKRETGMVYSNLGEIYYRTGDLETATDYFNHRLEISRSIGDRESEALALNNLAKSRLESGNASLGEPFLNEALKIAEEIGSPLVHARVLVLKCQFYSESGHSEPMHNLLDEAMSFVDGSQFNYLRPMVYIMRASAYLAAGQASQAEKQARSALTLAGKQRTREWEGMAYRVLAECQIATGHPHDAAKNIDRAMEILGPINTWQWKRAHDLKTTN